MVILDVIVQTPHGEYGIVVNYKNAGFIAQALEDTALLADHDDWLKLDPKDFLDCVPWPTLTFPGARKEGVGMYYTSYSFIGLKKHSYDDFGPVYGGTYVVVKPKEGMVFDKRIRPRN